MAQQITYVIEKKPDGTLSGYQSLIQELQGLPVGKWSISIKKYRKSRSGGQNNLMHMYFDIIADETGNSLQRVKDILKKQLLTTEMRDDDGEIMTNPKTGEVLTYVRDTSDLNTLEAASFTEEIRVWAMDWNIHLPLPEEMRELNFNKRR